jgi:hypothetical protein
MGHDTLEHCPYCDNLCHADWVDVGVPGAMVQCGPFHCEHCGSSEIGPHDKDRPLNEWEEATGWYAPGSEPGSSANVIGGKIVSYREMRQSYRDEFVNNPLWQDKKYVKEWWEKKRKGLI